MEKIKLNRKFVLNKGNDTIVLTDPDSDMTPDQVRKFYANQHPEILNGTVTGPTYDGDDIIYTFKTSVGVKG